MTSRPPKEQPPAIDLAFVLPGRPARLKHAFELGGSGRKLVIFIDVSDALVHSSEPLAGVVDLAHQALAFAASSRTGSREPDLEAAGATLDRIARDVVGRAPGPLHGDQPSATIVGLSEVNADPVEIGIEIALEVTDRLSIVEIGNLEEGLANHLSDLAVGYVDGNEVGSGAYSIFVYGHERGPLHSAVANVLERHGLERVAVVRELD